MTNTPHSTWCATQKAPEYAAECDCQDKDVGLAGAKEAFTPGPWTAETTNRVWRRFLTEDGRRASTPVAEAFTPADAQLIAAGPELVEALRMLHDETADYITRNNLGDPHHNRSMQLARAALSKARGES